MIFAATILVFICGVCLGAPDDGGSSSSSHAGHAKRRPDGQLIKFDYLDSYRDEAFTNAYLNGLYEVTQEDLHRLDRFKAELPELGKDNGFRLYLMIREMVVRGGVESFKCLYPHIRFDENYKYDVLLMAECANSNQPEILDFMMERGFDAQRFISGIIQLSEYLAIPRGCIGIVDLVAARNAEVEAWKGEIYSRMLRNFLFEVDELCEYKGLSNRDDEEEIADFEDFVHDLYDYHYTPADDSGPAGSRRPDLKRKRDAVDEEMASVDSASEFSEGEQELGEKSSPSRKRCRKQID
jgi:hypothetical protein